MQCSCVLFFLQKKNGSRNLPPSTDHPQYCAIAGSWEKSRILYTIIFELQAIPQVSFQSSGMIPELSEQYEAN